MEEQKYCFIQFKFKFETKLGEEVYLSGNIPELGNWDINRSEKLVTNKQEYPIWKSKENIKVLQNKEIEYKYLIKKQGKLYKWIETPNKQNIRLRIQNMLRVVILDPGSKIEKYTPGLQQSSLGTPSVSDNFDFDLDNNNQGDKANNDKDKDNDIGNDKDNDVGNGNGNEPISSPIRIRKYTRDDLHFSMKQNDNDTLLPSLNCSISSDSRDSINDDTDTITSIQDKELTKEDEIIMCIFYLPLCAYYNTETNEWCIQLTNEPIYHTMYSICEGNTSIKWIGLLKNANKITNDYDRERLYTLLQKKYNMYALKINNSMYDSLLLLFNEFLQPRFHYFSIKSSLIREFCNNETYWNVFRLFSEMVSNEIVKLISDSDKRVIFLNDYHFFLVPSLLYSICTNFKPKKVQKISIGLFMHSPFPSLDVFQTFAFREEILQSMMNCSVLGFHTFDSSRNFLRSVKQLLGIDFESTIKGDLALSYYGRKLIIRVANITPEPSMIKDMYDSEEFKLLYNAMAKKHEGKFIFVSLDNIQFISITKQKLEGYRRFLLDINQNSAKVVFIQYIKYSSDEVSITGEILQSKDQQELLKQIKDLARSINSEFGMEVIELKIQPITYTERLAAFAVGNCFIRTSKRESFSLGIYEFLILKSLMKDENDIEYMISEFSGVNKTLENTIKINPFDCNSIHKGFLLAFQPFFDKKGIDNKERDKKIAETSSAKKWFNSFWKDIKNYEIHEEDKYYIGSGLGLNFRLMKTEANFAELSKKRIIEDFENSSKRLMFFNFEEDNMTKINTELLKKILNNLDSLALDQRNMVFILTDKTQRKLSSYVHEYPNLIFASEKGYSYKMPKEQQWKLQIMGDSNEWIDIARNIISQYAKRCEGSYIETKEATVIWHFEDSDNDLAKMFAKTIINELEYSFKCDELAITKGQTSIEISNKDVNKGRFASFILKDIIKSNKSPEFICAIGNSSSDEKLFSYLRKKANSIKAYSKKAAIYTVLIGKRPSNAESYVQTLGDMKTILEEMTKSNLKQSASKSTYTVSKYVENISFNSNVVSTSSCDYIKSYDNKD